MTRVGIYTPDWILAWHNTDHKLTRSFAHLDRFAPCKTSFAAAPVYTWTSNLQKLAQRFTPWKGSLVQHGIRKDQQVDVLYCYGEPAAPKKFFEAAAGIPVVVTTGFMTDRYMAESGRDISNRQKEADATARHLESAAIVHFHSEGGRKRFLQYRPEFAEKARTIPFLLPNLKCARPASEATQDSKIRLLFVGAEGIRKGIEDVIAALDSLGSAYLHAHQVELTVVSRDCPPPQAKYPLQWHQKLPHAEVLALMQAADIFVLVPRRESYGLVFVEAMVAGCAIISDDEETRQEILGEFSLPVSPRDTASLAVAMKTLIENPELRAKMAQGARQRAQETFLPEVVGPLYGQCFQEIARH